MGKSRNKAVKKPLKRPTPALLRGLGSARVVEPGTWQRPPTPSRPPASTERACNWPKRRTSRPPPPARACGLLLRTSLQPHLYCRNGRVHRSQRSRTLGRSLRPLTPLRRARQTSAPRVGSARRSGRRGRRPATRRSPPPPPHEAGGLRGGSRPPAREPVVLL